MSSNPDGANFVLYSSGVAKTICQSKTSADLIDYSVSFIFTDFLPLLYVSKKHKKEISIELVDEKCQ